MSSIDRHTPAQNRPTILRNSRTSWSPVDLSQVLSGEVEALAPTVGARDDGQLLLYPAKTHSLASEPEAGKTWLALLVCAQQMRAGCVTYYIDYEDDARSVVLRLLAMGLDAALIERCFRYIRPSGPLRDTERRSLIEALVRDDVTVVVLDGFTEALTLEGRSLVDNQDIAEFWHSVPQPLADAGPAVLMLDHEVKSQQDRGRYAIGAQHKLAAISGAAYKLRCVEPFAVGRVGRSSLFVVKDRHSGVRSHTLNKDGLVGELLVDGKTVTDVCVSLSASPGRAARNEGEASMALDLVAAMERAQRPLASKGDIYDLVRGQSQRKTRALSALIEAGRVQKINGVFQVIEKDVN